ncbi:hypothetical protein ACH5RR_028138 [Cinchona calisaya]|uniref:At1g61320/AtMIF1 LRR domain-containing protein n=1 Tax=Cinchona calisaya TaxID=153742 RepID=A0ABD2YMY1_9GENT
MTYWDFIELAFFMSNTKFYGAKVRKFMNIVDGMIVRREQNEVNILKCCIDLPSYWLLDLEPYIYKFVSTLIECKIQELVFKVREYYTLPGLFYAASSLSKLHLTGFKLETPSDGLSLEIVGCPKLKNVRTSRCSIKFSKIEIQAPKLEQLSHHGTGRLSVVNVAACKSLKVLILHRITITPKWLKGIFSTLPLEVFELSDCEGLKNVRISSNHLKQLSLTRCVNLVLAEVDAPNLSSFSYAGVISLKILLEASDLDDIHLHIFSETSESQWHSELIEFLGNFNHFKVVKLVNVNPDKWIIPNDLRETLQSPLYDIKHLTLNLLVNLKQSMLLDLLDSFLWLAPFLDSLSFVYGPFRQTVELSFENSAAEGKGPCCTSVPFKCWRCSLKKVNCKNFQCIKELLMVKNYIVETAKILKSAEGSHFRTLRVIKNYVKQFQDSKSAFIIGQKQLILIG